MKAWVVFALTGMTGLLAACSDGREGTGAGGSSPGVLANVAAGSTGGTKSATSQTSSAESSTSQASTAMSTASSSAMSSTGSTTASSSTGMMLAEPLLPFCGCITDNLASVGLCQGCWNTAMGKGGACEQIIEDCGPACTQMLDALSTECGVLATPTCLEEVAAIEEDQIDDFAALLQCLCACPSCNNEACR